MDILVTVLLQCLIKILIIKQYIHFVTAIPFMHGINTIWLSFERKIIFLFILFQITYSLNNLQKKDQGNLICKNIPQYIYIYKIVIKFFQTNQNILRPQTNDLYCFVER